jgi:nicotinate-nucleotide adenylyltransferase
MTAIFGGRFDPPHVGHREAVRGLFQYPGVREVLILPSPSPVYQSTIASIADRLHMARLCFTSSGLDAYPSAVYIDPIEITRSQRFPKQPTYTYDTLLELGQCRDQRSGQRFVFVMGIDQLIQLPKWFRFPEVLSLAHWIVLERKSFEKEQAKMILQTWVAGGLIQCKGDVLWQVAHSEKQILLAPTSAPALSSTQIREGLLRTGVVSEGVLVPEVEAYLKEKRLYGMGQTCK